MANLLTLKLVAHASVDRDNNSYTLIDGQVKKETHYLITAQTRALLFTEVVKEVKLRTADDVKVYSVPITQCTESFSEFIRQQTKYSS